MVVFFSSKAGHTRRDFDVQPMKGIMGYKFIQLIDYYDTLIYSYLFANIYSTYFSYSNKKKP